MVEPSISLDIVANGKRLEGDNVLGSFVFATRIVKIATDARLSSALFTGADHLKTLGQCPPKPIAKRLTRSSMDDNEHFKQD